MAENNSAGVERLRLSISEGAIEERPRNRAKAKILFFCIPASPLGPNTTFIASARRSYLQFLFGVVGLPFLPTYNGFQFKSQTRTGPSSTLSIVGIRAIDRLRLNLEANETEQQRYILDFLPVNEQWNYSLGAVFRRFMGNGTQTWVISSLSRIFDYTSDEAENKLLFERLLNLGKYRLMLGMGEAGCGRRGRVICGLGKGLRSRTVFQGTGSPGLESDPFLYIRQERIQ